MFCQFIAGPPLAPSFNNNILVLVFSCATKTKRRDRKIYLYSASVRGIMRMRNETLSLSVRCFKRK